MEWHYLPLGSLSEHTLMKINGLPSTKAIKMGHSVPVLLLGDSIRLVVRGSGDTAGLQPGHRRSSRHCTSTRPFMQLLNTHRMGDLFCSHARNGSMTLAGESRENYHENDMDS